MQDAQSAIDAQGLRERWGLSWPCPHCESDQEGMHRTGGYDYDGSPYYQGPPCPFSPHRADVALLTHDLGQAVEEIERLRSLMRAVALDYANGVFGTTTYDSLTALTAEVGRE